MGCKVGMCEPILHRAEGQSKSLAKEKFAYAPNITYKLEGSRIVSQFAPKNSQGEKLDLDLLARELGYDHFNWTNYVTQDPHGITDRLGQKLNTPYNDPPQGGYLYDPADEMPFYWDLELCQRCKSRHHRQNPNNLRQFELVFEDYPADYRLQPGEKIEFITSLVGVREYDSQAKTAKWEVLYTFRWQLTNLHYNISRVSLVETDIPLEQLSPMLLSTMQLDGGFIKY
ncbi:MAG: hypothetical protein AAFQ41_08620 [Cyanobacteria bacterium J06623_7]